MESLKLKYECPKCGESRMKTWDELTDEQKFLAERLPASAEFTSDKRKKHRFCDRCWFEDIRIHHLTA